MSQLMAKSVAEKQMIARLAVIFNKMSERTSAGAAHPNPNPHGWKSWRDIPDSMIPTTSKRDPNNPIYGTRKYVNFRKQQIWFQIPDGVPVYLKNGLTDKLIYYTALYGSVILVAVNLYLLFTELVFPKRKAKKN